MKINKNELECLIREELEQLHKEGWMGDKFKAAKEKVTGMGKQAVSDVGTVAGALTKVLPKQAKMIGGAIAKAGGFAKNGHAIYKQSATALGVENHQQLYRAANKIVAAGIRPAIQKVAQMPGLPEDEEIKKQLLAAMLLPVLMNISTTSANSFLTAQAKGPSDDF